MLKKQVLIGLLLFLIVLVGVKMYLSNKKIDYSKMENWISYSQVAEKKVDVFWVYPTVYNAQYNNAPLYDKQMLSRAKVTLSSQASIFDGVTNIYAPLYRQVNISVLSMPEDEKTIYLSKAIADVENAFEYYLENINKGRPFILAGHSQGSDILTEIIKKYADSKKMKEQLVAAYIIGWSVTDDDLKKYPSMKLCEKSNDTGCIITYNSVLDGEQSKAPTILPMNNVVNPLSWTTNEKIASASKNLGARFYDPKNKTEQIIPEFTSAQVKDGGLVVAPKDLKKLSNLPFGEGIFHCYDYELFYENLKANVRTRINAFLAGYE